MTGAEALNIRFFCGDLNRDLSIRDYMRELLDTLFTEGEGFSGKRPFGNSGWEHDIAEALVQGGAIPGAFYEAEEGEAPELEHYDIDAYERMVGEMIAAI